VASSGDSEIRFLPELLVARGHALLAKGDAPGAHEACARALTMQEERQLFGPDKVYEGDALTCIGETEIALGQLGDGLAHLERSVSITKRFPAPDLGLARFALARALTAAKREPARARELAESARNELRAAPGMEKEASEVEQWLEVTGGTR